MMMMLKLEVEVRCWTVILLLRSDLRAVGTQPSHGHFYSATLGRLPAPAPDPSWHICGPSAHVGSGLLT
eukprot:11019754-Karenia_brevis.AAC.1